MLIIKKKLFRLGRIPTESINNSAGAAERNILILVKQIQNFAEVSNVIMIKVTSI